MNKTIQEQINKITLEISDSFPGYPTVKKEYRQTEDRAIDMGRDQIVKIFHEKSGIEFYFDEFKTEEKNQLAGLNLLKMRLKEKLG